MYFIASVLSLSILFYSVSGADQIVLSENAKQSNESLLWGPYKPNLYLGLRPRIPKSLSTGLLWAKVDDFQTVQSSTYCSFALISPSP